MEPQEHKKENIKKAKSYLEFFSSVAGKIVLADLANKYRLAPFSSVLEADGKGRVDELKTIYNQGNRDVVQHIFDMLWIARNADQYLKREIIVQEDTVEDTLNRIAEHQQIL